MIFLASIVAFPGELGSDGPFPVSWPQGHGGKTLRPAVIWSEPSSWEELPRAPKWMSNLDLCWLSDGDKHFC